RASGPRPTGSASTTPPWCGGTPTPKDPTSGATWGPACGNSSTGASATCPTSGPRVTPPCSTPRARSRSTSSRPRARHHRTTRHRRVDRGAPRSAALLAQELLELGGELVAARRLEWRVVTGDRLAAELGVDVGFELRHQLLMLVAVGHPPAEAGAGPPPLAGSSGESSPGTGSPRSWASTWASSCATSS